MPHFSGRLALKVTGLLRGSVLVESLDITVVSELRAEIQRLLGPTECEIKIVAAGRALQDGTKTLAECGVRATTSLLVLRGGASTSSTAQEAEAARLARLKAAAKSLVSRDAWDRGSLSVENQRGDVVELAKQDREALMIGLALHQKGKRTLDAGRLHEAYAELSLAEESFSCCKSDILNTIDNVGMLKLDLVWAAFLLQDSGLLAVSKSRLEHTRAALVRAHGANMERMRQLHGGFQPESSLYVRLELLEGVLAYYSGNVSEARKCLTSAEKRCKSLELDQGAVAQLSTMGFSERTSKRALRFTQGDVEEAARLIVQEAERAVELDKQRHARFLEERKMRKHGLTPSGKLVDAKFLAHLSSSADGLGYAEPLAAEALRKNENDLQAALDELCDPERRDAIAAAVAARMLSKVAAPLQRKGLRRRKRASRAQRSKSRRRRHEEEPAGPSTSHAHDNDGSGADEAQADDGGAQNAVGEADGSEEDDRSDPSGSTSGAEEEGKERDKEMEAALVADVDSDPLAAYDVDVAAESEAIAKFMRLLDGQPGNRENNDERMDD